MVCKNCKHVLDKDHAVCQSCGHPVITGPKIEHAVNEPPEQAVIKKSKAKK